MVELTSQRCFNHGPREAVARCFQCRRYFCRECVTEHDERLVCSSCLKKIPSPDLAATNAWGFVATLIQCVMGTLMVWLFFYFLGQALLSLPTSFHEGTVWEMNGGANQ